MLPGSKVDPNMPKRAMINNHLLPGEKYIADKAYIGDEDYITPIKGKGSSLLDWQKYWNSSISSVRVEVAS